MKKKTIRIIAVIILLCMTLPSFAFAATESSAYIAYTSAHFTRSGNDVNIYFSIVGRHIMNEIGVSEIRLFEKNGVNWNKVCTFDSSDSNYTAALLSYNTSAKSSYVTYSGDSSKDYMAVLYFYAADDDGSDTIPYYAYS